jgi:hypothetical protein
MADVTELRRAAGTRFQYIIDSYIYAVAMTEPETDIYEAQKGRAMMLAGPFLRRILSLAAKQHYTMNDLGMFDAESEFLSEHDGVLILEDQFSCVEVHWYKDHYDAATEYVKMMHDKEICVSPSSHIRYPKKILQHLYNLEVSR